MAFKSLLFTLALTSATAATAATISPVDSGSTGISFPTSAIPGLDPTCGATRPGNPGLGFGIGFSGPDEIFEARTHAEYRRSDVGPNARLSLSFDIELDGGSNPTICVFGYRGDGIISAGDFQLEDAVLLGRVFFPGGGEPNLPLDVTGLLDLGGEFFGVQFVMDGLQDNIGVLTNLQLTVEETQEVPEPAATGLIGLGVLALARRRRRG